MRAPTAAGLLGLLTLALVPALVYADFLKPKKGADGRKVLEVMYFQGGFGVEFIEEAGRRFEAMHPDVKVDIWASPRIAEKIRLRLLSGDTPDIIAPGWQLDVDRVIEAGMLRDLQPALSGPPPRGSGRWEDDFYPGILEPYRFEGRTHGIPFFYITHVFWYNRGMFEKNGWKPPETWGEFDELCGKIKASGKAPIALQGRYIGYLGNVFMNMLDRAREPGFADGALRLEPGTWADPAVVDCAAKIQDFFRKGHFQEGCLGMSHTEAQMEFFQGRAAMVWCGTWLASEMHEVIPAGFRYSCFATPALEGGRGDPTRMPVSSEYFFVCRRAKHPELAEEFLRFMCDPEVASGFVKGREALTGIKAANENPPDSLKAVTEILKRAKSFRAPAAHGNPYPSWNRVFESALSELVTRPAGSDKFELTPQEFAEKLERRAGELRHEKAAKAAGN
jgi:ABC-type glycerol-3-phosphate transport system substrate-binding protein